MYVAVSENLRFKRDSGKEKLRREGCCRMCLRPSAELADLWMRPDAIRVMTRHHLVPQRWFNVHKEWIHLRDCDANIVPLCRACHDLVELRNGSGSSHRRMLRRLLTQAEISFIIQVRGYRWFEGTYPRVRVT